MPQFVYSFGYETPDVAAANQRLDMDIEFSKSISIEATDADEARRKGEQAAESYIQALADLYGVDRSCPWYFGWLEDGNPPREEYHLTVHEDGAIQDLQKKIEERYGKDAASWKANPELRRTK